MGDYLGRKEWYDVNTTEVIFNLRDNGGRRLGIERRQFSYSDHIPERRCSVNRRSEKDRRNNIDRRSGSERRIGEEHTPKALIKISKDRREGKKKI